jgi:hypothetical protein
MPAATVEKPASARKSTGPYIRVSERELWDELYEEFSTELRVSAEYPEGVAMTEKQIDVLAYNCAYRAIWALRD